MTLSWGSREHDERHDGIEPTADADGLTRDQKPQASSTISVISQDLMASRSCGHSVSPA